VRVESVGDVTSEDISGYYDGLAREPWMRPRLRFLVDNRALTSVPPNDEFVDDALAAGRRAFYLGGARVAVLVKTTFQYAITRQFAVLSDQAGAKIEPFYEVDEALRWLGDPTSDPRELPVQGSGSRSEYADRGVDSPTATDRGNR